MSMGCSEAQYGRHLVRVTVCQNEPPCSFHNKGPPCRKAQHAAPATCADPNPLHPLRLVTGCHALRPGCSLGSTWPSTQRPLQPLHPCTQSCPLRASLSWHPQCNLRLTQTPSPQPNWSLLGGQEGLWWVSEDPRARSLLQRTVLLASLALALAGLEGRVLLRAFGQFLGLQPPWSVALLSTALYGGAALVLLHFAGASQWRSCSCCLVGSDMVPVLDKGPGQGSGSIEGHGSLSLQRSWGCTCFSQVQTGPRGCAEIIFGGSIGACMLDPMLDSKQHLAASYTSTYAWQQAAWGTLGDCGRSVCRFAGVGASHHVGSPAADGVLSSCRCSSRDACAAAASSHACCFWTGLVPGIDNGLACGKHAEIRQRHSASKSEAASFWLHAVCEACMSLWYYVLTPS